MADLPWRIDGDTLRLSVRLTPKSAKDRIGGLWRDEKEAVWLCAQVRAVPEKGKANAALIKLLAKQLGLAPRAFALDAGDTSRLKRFIITGDAATVAARLQILAEQQGLAAQ
jgi:uncharacterized protein YggU (UPF0235/DUF167 family)